MVSLRRDTGAGPRHRGAWLAAAQLYMGGIFALSSVPGEITPEAAAVYQVFAWLSPDLQNLLHVPLFAGLAWLWCRALENAGLTWVEGEWLALFISLFYGVADEFHQSFVPGRLANGTDMLLNALGSVAAVAVYAHARRQHAPRQGRPDAGR